MSKSMAVLGTGAIGTSIGADLTNVGCDVVLIDQWPAHVEAMKAGGARIKMKEEEFVAPVKAFHLCEMKDLHNAPMRQFDIVFLTCKSYDTTWLTEFIKPFLKSDGVLVSVQNSLNDEWISLIVGRERDIGCAFELSADCFEPGRITRNTDRVTSKFVLGELNGKITPRVQEVAQILGQVGKTQVSDNIWGAKWTKLVFNTMVSTTRAALDASKQVMQQPEVLDLVVKLGRETAQVALAQGVTLEPILGLKGEDFAGLSNELFRKYMLQVFKDTGERSTSMIQHDVVKGRLTESDYINGVVARKGEAVNVPAPANKAMARVMMQIDEGELQPGLSNLKILNQYISGSKAMA